MTKLKKNENVTKLKLNKKTQNMTKLKNLKCDKKPIWEEEKKTKKNSKCHIFPRPQIPRTVHSKRQLWGQLKFCHCVTRWCSDYRVHCSDVNCHWSSGEKVHVLPRFTCHKSFVKFICGLFDETCRWRVCYKWGYPVYFFFLAASSSSRSRVVGLSIDRLCEKVTFRVSYGN